MHGINDKYWTFLTGKPEEVDMLRHADRLCRSRTLRLDKDKARHSGMIALRQRTNGFVGHFSLVNPFFDEFQFGTRSRSKA